MSVCIYRTIELSNYRTIELSIDLFFSPVFQAFTPLAFPDFYVSDVRNYGFAGAITLDPYPGEPLRRPFEVAMKMGEKGFLVRYGGDTIQLAPMFVMERPEMESLVGALADSLQELA